MNSDKLKEMLLAKSKEYQTQEPFLLGRLPLMFPSDALEVCERYIKERDAERVCKNCEHQFRIVCPLHFNFNLAKVAADKESIKNTFGCNSFDWRQQ